MGYKLVNFTDQIISRTTLNGNVFLRNFAENVVKTAEPNTPKDTGDLRNNILKSVIGLKGKIKWIKDYAVYQEVKQYKNYTTPGTGPHFAENSIHSVNKKLVSIARKSGLI